MVVPHPPTANIDLQGIKSSYRHTPICTSPVQNHDTPKNQTHIIVKQLTCRQNQVTIFEIDLKSPFHHFGTLGLLRLGCMIYMYEIDTV